MNESKRVPRYVRLRALVGNPRAVPPVPGIIPMSAASVWRAVKQGDMPAPVKLRPGITAWDLAEIEKWMAAKKVAV